MHVCMCIYIPRTKGKGKEGVREGWFIYFYLLIN